MTSLGAKIVKAAIRLYTYPYRKNHSSLSRSVHFKKSNYKQPKGFNYRIEEKNGVKIEILTPQNYKSDYSILHFHGGGHTVSMNDFYRKISEKYAKRTGCAVYSIDYFTNQDLRHPALLINCFNAYIGLIDDGLNPEKLIGIGDSMGANLMLATCLKLRDEGIALPHTLICLSAFIDMAASGDSYRKNCYSDPLYSLPRNQSFEENEEFIRRKSPYCGNTDFKDPYLSPAYADFNDFPKMLIQCGDCETSESDSDMLFQKAFIAGVDVRITKYEGMFHVFQYLTPFLKESKAAWNEIIDFINEEKL